MKKVLLVTSFFLLVSLSCERPESSVDKPYKSLSETTTQGSISIEEARSYFTNTVLPSTASARAAAQSKYERDIDWGTAKKVKQANGLEVIAVPISYKTNAKPGVMFWDSKTPDDKKRPKIENALDARECLLSFKDKSGHIQTQIVQYIPTKEYKQQKKGNISKDDFSGWVIAMTWDERPIIGYEFKNGKDIKQLTPVNSTSGGRVAYCEFSYYQSIAVACYPCGNNCTACDVGISGGYQGYCSDPSSNSGTDGNTGVSYGGDGIYYYTPTAQSSAPGTVSSTYLKQFVREIEVNLTDPCFKAVAAKLMGATNGGTEILGETIGQMLWNLLSANTQKKIFIEQEANDNRNIDGRYLPGGSNGILYLNTNALGSASEEYIAATLIHELVHGYYHETKGRSLGNDAQHIDMATYYVQPMAEALVGIYGMSPQNAEAIAWGGLQDTPQWQSKSSSERNNIAITNGNYRTGVSGHKDCR